MQARWKLPLLAAVLVSFVLPGNATMLRQMTLSDLATRADKVFRGVVVGIDSTTVRAGGSELPVMVYRLKVVEEFKGTFDAPKSEPVIEIRMLGVTKRAMQVGNAQRLSTMQDLPTLAMGQDYVLFTTRPSAIGLSTTVGLGQGKFSIDSGSKGELTANTFGNAGLAGRQAAPSATLSPDVHLPRSGAIPYADLARAIRQVTGGAR